MDDPVYDNSSGDENGKDINSVEDPDISSDEEGNINKDQWKINLNKEKEFWLFLKDNGFTYEPMKCPTCQIGSFIIKESKKNILLNPLFLRCNYRKCRHKDNLRKYTFLNKIRSWPASVAYNILENFILLGLNANKLKTFIEDKYAKIVNINTIQKFLLYIRKIIYQYMQIKYRTTLIGGFDDLGQSKIVALDESLFLHNDSGEQIWVIGGIETKFRRIRLALTKIRNSSVLEQFVYDNFLEGTHFTHDGWGGYTFLNNNINYTHETHVHGGGQFGLGLHSTAHIENLWANLKKNIMSIYGIMPKSNFPLFLKEAEFRYNMNSKTKSGSQVLLCRFSAATANRV